MPPSCRVRRATFPPPTYYPLLDNAGKQTGEVDSHYSLCEQGGAIPRQLKASLEPGGENGVRRGHSETNASRARSQTTMAAHQLGDPNLTTPARDAFPLSTCIRTSKDKRTRHHMVRAPSHGLVAEHFTSRRIKPTRCITVTRATEFPTHDNAVVNSSQVDMHVPNGPESGLVESVVDEVIDDEAVEDQHHEDEIVEHLDVIDPYVATVSHLSNAANSILIPPMSIYSRRPVIHLPAARESSTPIDSEKPHREHMDDLDRHVEHVLRRRDKVRQVVAGIWSFIQTPMGIVTALYGFCVVFWGAAIVLFLLNWIPTKSKDQQGLWVEVSSQVENALFTVTGIGLLPWRVVDTYRIIQIWKLKRISTRLRRKAGLPNLYDENDLPDPEYDPNYVHVLTDKQQMELHHKQKEFAASQTWYRPHGTETHRAFPIGTALLICLFVDGNSCFQAILCACMWSMNRFQRPAWTTGTLIPASFICGIIATILIWRGGQKTKRTKEVEEKLRDALEVESRTGVPAAVVAVTQYQTDPATDVAFRDNVAIPEVRTHLHY